MKLIDVDAFISNLGEGKYTRRQIVHLLRNAPPLNLDTKPCDCCTRLDNPEDCDRVTCLAWRAWWLRRWRDIQELLPAERFGGQDG